MYLILSQFSIIKFLTNKKKSNHCEYTLSSKVCPHILEELNPLKRALNVNKLKVGIKLEGYIYRKY